MTQEIERKNIETSSINWDEHAEYWDSFEDGKVYSKNIFRLLSDKINIENLSILDFGCGTGLLIDYMTEKAGKIVAIDTSKKMIEVLNQKKYKNVETINEELKQKTIDNNPSLKGKFDLVVSSSVCAFLPNFEEVLKTIKSILKPDGTFIQWDWLMSEKDPNFGFTEKMIRNHYESVGLKVESISIPFHLIENEEKMEVIMAIGKL